MSKFNITTHPPCHFEAKGREIPLRQQLKGGWLDQIGLLSTKFWVNVTVWGFLPASRVEMTCLGSY